MLRIAPFQLQQARRLRGGPTDSVDHRVVLGDQIIAAHHVDAGPETVGQIAELGFQAFRPHPVSGRVHQIPRQHDGACHGLGFPRIGPVRQGQTGWFAVGGLEGRKAIAADHPGDRCQCRVPAFRQRRQLPVTGRKRKGRRTDSKSVPVIADAQPGVSGIAGRPEHALTGLAGKAGCDRTQGFRQVLDEFLNLGRPDQPDRAGS